MQKNNFFFLSTLIVVFVVLHLSCNGQTTTANTFSADEIGLKVAGNYLSRQDLMMYRSDFLNTFHYAEACAAMGAIRLASALNDTMLFQKVESRYRGLLAVFDTLPANHVDANIIGVIPLSLYSWNKNPEYFRMGLKMADLQWEAPLSNGLSNQTRFWIDDIFMIGSLQVEAFKSTGDKTYISRAAKEARAYLEKLQQPNGLFFHGTNAPFFWGRGNGWVAAGLAEILSVLPADDPNYSFIRERYCKMMASLLQFQSPTGMWRQLIDNKEAWEESSCTAMFGYAILIGVEKGFLPEKEYRKSYEKAWNALANKIDSQGNLEDICVGTGQSKDVSYYLSRNRVAGDLHGQAPLLWFAASLFQAN